MNRSLYQWINWVVWIIITLLFFFFIFLSSEAIQETENWRYFDFDFTGKDKVITAYGGLLAALLSFTTILFIILDLIYQRRSKTIEEEEAESNRVQLLKDRLFEIKLFIEQITSTVLLQGKEFEAYIEKKSSTPTLMHICKFYPNTFTKFLLDNDRVTIYQAFREFQPGNQWQKDYINLIKIIDFYDQLFPSIREKYEKHNSDIVNLKREANIYFQEFADALNDKRNSMILRQRNVEFQEIDKLVYGLLSKYSHKIRTFNEREISNEVADTDFSFPKDEIILPFLDELMKMFNMPFMTEDSYNLYELLSKGIRVNRLIEDLIARSLNFKADLEAYNDDYFKEDSSFIKDLEGVKTHLESLKK